MMDGSINRPRRWWVAALWSLAGRGVGQLYNGQPGRALLAFALPVVWLYATLHLPSSVGSQVGVLVFAALHLWILVDAVSSAYLHRRAFTPPRFDGVATYASVVVGSRLIDTLLIGTFLVVVLDDQSGSMHPTVGSGDRVVANLTAYRFSPPQRGDIVYFSSPVGGSQRLTSRVIGLPGEQVEIRDKRVFVDGVLLRETWVHHGDPHTLWPQGDSQRDHFGPVRVPAASYFVLADNRDAGFDSRQWNRFVGAEDLLGRLGFVLWSRHPREGIRWWRLGRAVHQDIVLPVDAAPARYAAAKGEAMLPAAAAAALAAALALVAIGAPVGNAWRRLVARREATAPFSVVTAAPACASAAVRAAHAAGGEVDGPSWRWLRAWDAAGRDPQTLRAQQDRLAAVLQALRVEHLPASELATVQQELDRLAGGRALVDPALRCLLHWRRAAVMHRLASRRRDTEGLRESVHAYRRAAAESHPATAALRWAAIHNDLGTALQTLGEWQDSHALLSEAIAAYTTALGQRRRERVPIDWATTQHNLGNALRARAERSPVTDDLDAALQAYSAALQERSVAADPVGHAMTLNNFGVAARLLGARRNDPRPVERAVLAHRQAATILQRCAPAYVEIPAGNLAEDLELLQHLGLAQAAA